MMVAQMVQTIRPDVRAIVARMEKHKSVQGKKSKIEAILLPSYVFFEAPEDMQSISWMPTENVIRVLSQDGIWQLSGEDERFAKWLFRYDGLLSFSKAYKEGDRIHIISGPLKDMEGHVKRVDKRGHSGQVALEFNRRTIMVWLGFDLVKPRPEEL